MISLVMEGLPAGVNRYGLGLVGVVGMGGCERGNVKRGRGVT
jgi:hypothetical protein